MSDAIDYGQEATMHTEAVAAHIAVKQLHTPLIYSIVWKDSDGKRHEHQFEGTCDERIEFIKMRGIDQAEFAFSYIDSHGRHQIGGNCEALKRNFSKPPRRRLHP